MNTVNPTWRRNDMVLKDFALLASDTARTKAYLQVMLYSDYIPSLCVIFTDDFDSMVRESENYIGSLEKGDYFNRNIPLFTLICKYELSYIIVPDKDVNSAIMKKTLETLTQKFIIYSGYGGYILKPHLFQLGKKYLHIHAGLLPEYRGSTTAYYSILDKGTIGVTALFLNEGIDEGDIISQQEYPMPKDNIDIDYIYEPFLRAKELIHALEIYRNLGEYIPLSQDGKAAETYFIIHPTLKHLAIKKALGGVAKPV